MSSFPLKSQIQAQALALEHKAVDMTASLVIPKHIGIIMDGNRRWANQRGLKRSKGHEVGADALEKTVKRCADLGVEVLTVYAFSSENWKKRTQEELREIFSLLIIVCKRKLKALKENGVVLGLLGEVNRFPLSVRKVLYYTAKVLKKNNRIKLNLALNYGGRDEILRAFKKIMGKKVSAKEVNEELVSKNLDTNGMPEPELIIRTGGHRRLSNFLVWQCTYSELYFTDVLWPDFDADNLDEAIAHYSKCQRNFGK